MKTFLILDTRSADMMRLTEGHLIEPADEIVTASDCIETSEGAQIVFT